MTWVGWLGVTLAVLGIVAVARSLATGIVPGRWPAPPIGRSERPFYYWFCIFGYALSAAVGLWLSAAFIS